MSKAQPIYPVEHDKADDDPHSPVHPHAIQARKVSGCRFNPKQDTSGIPGKHSGQSGIKQPGQRAIDRRINPVSGRDCPDGTGKSAKRAGQAGNTQKWTFKQDQPVNGNQEGDQQKDTGGQGQSESDRDQGISDAGFRIRDIGSVANHDSGHWLLVAGCWLLVAGCWLLVAGYWLLVAGYWLLVTGCWLLVAGCWLLVTGCWLLVTGCWLLVAGYWLLVTGCWLLVAGCWLLVAGCWLLVAGCWLLVAGCWLNPTPYTLYPAPYTTASFICTLGHR